MLGLDRFGGRLTGVRKTELNLATFADYRHGLTKRRRVPAAMTRKRSLAAVQEASKELTGARKVGATLALVSWQAVKPSVRCPSQQPKGLEGQEGV